MKFSTLDGRTSNERVNPYKYQARLDGSSRSMVQQKVRERLLKMYPMDVVLEEWGVEIDTDLTVFFDFFIPSRFIAIEVQGEQHFEFVSFFHGTKQNFAMQKTRDSKKSAWCGINNIMLLTINAKEAVRCNDDDLDKLIGQCIG